MKFIGPFVMCCTLGFSQNIDLDRLGKAKWLRYNGGILANAVYYNGTANRQELTYYLTGNLNFNLAGLYNIPLSFTYSNQNFDFPNPFTFNRLSLQPSYKWIKMHIGDVGMNFSPYTVNGHQFTGGGFELTPEGKFQISALYGRFLKATEYNAEAPRAITAYQRMGYGIKTAYDFDFLKLGFILFKAKDDETSLKNPIPLELRLSPKENMVLSLESEFRLFKKAQIRVEYAISGVTEDTRLTATPAAKGNLSFLLKENSSTRYYNAFNVAFSYPTNQGTLGAGYERIDPGYKTLGAYYFNNDLENITINASRLLFNNKLNLSVNAGLQKDNLDNLKTTDQQRIVSSVNLNYTASERLGIHAAYSNFQSYTNFRNQFDYINQIGQFDNIDTLNYRQISQNANMALNYIVKKTKKRQHMTALNLVYQNSNNQQEGADINNAKTIFYNGIATYSLVYPQRELTISLAANTSYNSIGLTDYGLIFGPTLAIGKLFLEKKIRTNISSSYNTSHAKAGKQNSIYNLRFGSHYTFLEKHHINFNLLALFRKTLLNTNRDLTLTIGYSYTFDNFKLEFLRRNRNAHDRHSKENILSFRYRNVTYSGTITALNQQLLDVFESPLFTDIPPFKKDELQMLLASVRDQEKETAYRESALLFLKALYGYHDFKSLYNTHLLKVISKIRLDMQRIDFKLEQLFVETKVKFDRHLSIRNPNDIQITAAQQKEITDLRIDHKERTQKLLGHRWMEKEFAQYEDIGIIENPWGHLKEFKDHMAIRAYRRYEETRDAGELEKFLEIKIIDYYYKKSINSIKLEDVELRYINN